VTDNQGDGLSDSDDVFSDCSDGTDGTQDDSNDSDDSDDEAFEDDKLPPPEHYLDGEASLDIKRLRQRRYRPGTIYGSETIGTNTART